MLLNCGVGEDSRESLWTARRSNQSILKEISPEYSLERLMLKLQYFWSPDAKSWLLWKDPDAGKGWGQKEKGTTEVEMVGWHQWLNRHGFGWTPGVGDGQGGLACFGSWGGKELDTTEWLNWTDLGSSVTSRKVLTVPFLWSPGTDHHPLSPSAPSAGLQASTQDTVSHSWFSLRCVYGFVPSTWQSKQTIENTYKNCWI